jgi:HAMP domain-containing protein
VLPPKPTLPPAQRRLVQLYQRLSETDRATLTAFAEFLAARATDIAGEAAPVEPLEIPRPADESVIAAIRRLSRTYHMLDKGAVLHETSGLMSAHILQGRAAAEVIDELEALFQRHYMQLRAARD